MKITTTTKKLASFYFSRVFAAAMLKLAILLPFWEATSSAAVSGKLDGLLGEELDDGLVGEVLGDGETSCHLFRSRGRWVACSAAALRQTKKI